MAACPKCSATIENDARFCPDCGQPLSGFEPESSMRTMSGLETLDINTKDWGGASVPTLEIGAVFADRYVIEEVIGRGGMGVVYRAADNLSETTVALKLIRPERLAGKNAVKRLIAEGITARDIRHPNIVSVYDVGETGGQPFVSMEYLEGKSLRAWHREQVQNREDVPLRVAARIIAEILDGLKAAHDAGVIHRDLKPENIVLIGEPTDAAAPLKVLDFGIARATGGGLESGTGTGIGTPRYMAPEQITNADSAGPAADLYSVSVMFYELLVDVLPQGHWQPPSGGRSDVPHGIDTLIEKGLANRPGNRPQSAKDYRAALVNAVNLTAYDPKKKKKKRDDHPIGKPDIPFGKIAIWGGAGIAGFIALLIVIDLINSDGGGTLQPCEGLTGAAYQSCVTPTSNKSYAQLSGTWYSSVGSTIRVEVDASGYAVGEGVASNGEPVDIEMEFSGSTGQYIIVGQMSGQTQTGSMMIIDPQHIRYSDSYGRQACYHINHNDRKTC